MGETWRVTDGKCVCGVTTGKTRRELACAMARKLPHTIADDDDIPDASGRSLSKATSAPPESAKFAESLRVAIAAWRAQPSISARWVGCGEIKISTGRRGMPPSDE